MSSNRTPLHEAAARGDLTACKAEMGKAVVSGGPDAVRKLLETPTQGFEETALVRPCATAAAAAAAAAVFVLFALWRGLVPRAS